MVDITNYNMPKDYLNVNIDLRNELFKRTKRAENTS